MDRWTFASIVCQRGVSAAMTLETFKEGSMLYSDAFSVFTATGYDFIFAHTTGGILLEQQLTLAAAVAILHPELLCPQHGWAHSAMLPVSSKQCPRNRWNGLPTNTLHPEEL